MHMIMNKVKNNLHRLRINSRNWLDVSSEQNLIPDKAFVKIYYQKTMGRKIDLREPKLLSEKLNWMKLYYHDPLFTVCSDKYRMREYVKLILGEGYTPKLLGKWDRAEDIDFNMLPNQFVIKTNHDGGPIVCLDKRLFDCETARSKLKEKLNRDYYHRGREWSYKNIKRCIFAEELLGDGKEDLVDYKFFCFWGEPKVLYTTSEHTDAKHGGIDYFDMGFRHLPVKHGIDYPQAQKIPQKPNSFEEMIEVARRLSSYGEGIPFVRVDLYSVNGRIYVGEMTFYPTNGMIDYDPPEWNRITGDYLQLPRKNGWKYQKGRDNEWIKNVLTS